MKRTILFIGLLLSFSSHAALVGKVNGSFGVSSGSANYSIPIDVPPGRGGMQPEIAINYNSAGGNGTLGVGFSLQAFSMITRCGLTIATDGIKGGVNYDGNDRFCLDGQKLIAVKGRYGGDGTEYRTEIDSFAKIVSYKGRHGVEPWKRGVERWKIWDKSGRIMEYFGFSLRPAGVTNKKKVWLLKKTSDTVGNSITYTYSYGLRSGGEIYLSGISYSGGEVKFYYEDRKDKFYGYVGGGINNLTKRLNTIKVLSGEQEVRKYTINYAPVKNPTDKSKVVSVEQCNLKKECLPPVSFGWGDEGSGSFSYSSNSLPKAYFTGPDGQSMGTQLADINGDGRVDIIQLYNPDSEFYKGAPQRRVFLNYGHRFAYNRNYSRSLPKAYFTGPDGQSMGTQLADINGDGLVDIIQLYNPDSEFYKGAPQRRVYLNYGHRFAYNRNYSRSLPDAYFTGPDGQSMGTQLADINGDGLVDLIQLYLPHRGYYSGNAQRRVYLNYGHRFAYNRNYSRSLSNIYFTSYGGQSLGTQLADINGDGLVDLIQLYNPDSEFYKGAPQRKVLLNNGSRFTYNHDYSNSLPKVYFTGPDGQSMGTQLADINSDGLVDLIQLYNPDSEFYKGAPQRKVLLNNGRRFTYNHDYSNSLPKVYFTGPDGQSMGTQLADINSDGVVDLIQLYNPDSEFYKGAPQRKVLLNNGRRFDYDKNYSRSLPKVYFTGPDGQSMGTQLADINSDGVVDLIQLYNPDSEFYKGAPQRKVLLNKKKISKVTEIKNGTYKVALSYIQLVSNNKYVKQHGGYPDIGLQTAMSVVDRISVNNGIGGTSSVSYKYGGLKANLRGRGSLGFQWIEATDGVSGITTRTEYQQDFPYIGSPSKVVQRLANGKVISRNTIIYAHKKSGRIFQPYAHWSEEQYYGITGGRTPIKRVVTVNSDLDSYGNIGTIKVVTSGGGKSFDKTSVNVYDNYPDKWILGRLRSAQVRHRAPGRSSIIRKSSFTYYNNGLLKSETIEPGSSKAKTTAYEYDGYGNKTKVTVSAPGLTSRVSTVKYDSSGRFPETTTNALGHSETREFDSVCGKPVKLTGPNKLATNWQYDALCRKIKETRADGTATTWVYTWDRSVANSVYNITETASGSPVKVAWFDALERKIRTRHTGFNGRAIDTDTKYNAKGEVERQSLPYFGGEQIHWVKSSYDALGRPLTVTRPDGRNTRYSYNGLTIGVTDASGRTKTTTKDAMGQVVRVDEPMGSYLTHKHDAAGNLIEADANGVITKFSYDRYGRKSSTTNPDMGGWRYDYNAYGELVSQRDAKGQTVRIEYDRLGRMVKRIEPEGTSSWTYDTAANGIGKLAVETGYNGIRKEYAYDNLGRPAAGTTQHNGKSYRVATKYDSYSRVSVVQRPGGLTVENVYNKYGYMLGSRSPKKHINAYDWKRVANLLTDSLKRYQELSGKVTYYAGKEKEYRAEAANYRALAADLEWHSKNAIREAEHLRAVALKLEEGANFLQSNLKLYRDELIDLDEMMTRIENRNHLYIEAYLESAYYDFPPDIYEEFGDYFYERFSYFVPPTTETLKLVDRLVVTADFLLRDARDNRREADELDILAANFANSAAQKINLARDVLAEADKMKAMHDKYRKQFESARNNYLTYKARDAAYDDKHIWFYRVKAMDAAGRTTALTYGNGLSTYKTYDNSNGQLDTILTGFNGAASVQHLSYEYDANDNVISRHNKRLNIREYFSYDRMDRLAGSAVRGKFNGIAYNSRKDYRYHAHGGLRFMTGNGSYTYNNNAHRPQRISGEIYAYDANGNMRGAKGRSYQWKSFNKISSISKNGNSVNYQYDAGRSRFKKTGFNGNGNFVEHIYIGKLYEREQTAGTGIVKHKHFVYLPNGQLAAVHVKSTHNGQARPDETRYMHRDNLGSIDTITDGRGNVVERMSFEAFGKRRAGNWRALDLNGGVQFASFTKRGFTGHEHIDEFRLINMNGRIYDPELGIFLSADPTVQLPHTPMSYNRYAYAGNNPLKYVDLDGYSWVSKAWKKIKRWVKKNKHYIVAAVAIAAAVFTAGTTLAFLGYKSMALAIQAGAFGAIVASGAAAGFVMGAITTGTLRGALEGAAWGAVSAGLTYGIGHGALGAGLGRFGKAVAHGVAQGAIGSLRGGTFKAGFAGGFLSHAVPVQGGFYSKLVQKTVIGGTAAEISGGKFANGAKSAAFVYLFNELGSASQRKLGEVNGIGSRRSFVIRSDDRLRVEPYSHTVGADQFSYDVDYNLITSDGKVLGNARPLNAFGKPKLYENVRVTTGLNGGGPDRVFQVDNNYGDWTMWHISIPQQYTTHQNSAGWNLQVYEVR